MSKPNVGAFIRQVREDRGLTQAQLALYTGIAQSEVSRIESGARQNPSPEALRRIGEALGIPPRQLMVLAGYIEEGEPEQLDPWERLENALLRLEGLTTEDAQEILEYTRFRIARRAQLREAQKSAAQEAKQHQERLLLERLASLQGERVE